MQSARICTVAVGQVEDGMVNVKDALAAGMFRPTALARASLLETPPPPPRQAPPPRLRKESTAGRAVSRLQSTIGRMRDQEDGRSMAADPGAPDLNEALRAEEMALIVAEKAAREAAQARKKATERAAAEEAREREVRARRAEEMAAAEAQ